MIPQLPSEHVPLEPVWAHLLSILSHMLIFEYHGVVESEIRHMLGIPVRAGDPCGGAPMN